MFGALRYSLSPLGSLRRHDWYRVHISALTILHLSHPIHFSYLLVTEQRFIGSADAFEGCLANLAQLVPHSLLFVNRHFLFKWFNMHFYFFAFGLGHLVLHARYVKVHLVDALDEIGSPGIQKQYLMQLFKQKGLLTLIFVVQGVDLGGCVECTTQQLRYLMLGPDRQILVHEVVEHVQFELLRDVLVRQLPHRGIDRRVALRVFVASDRVWLKLLEGELQ